MGMSRGRLPGSFFCLEEILIMHDAISISLEDTPCMALVAVLYIIIEHLDPAGIGENRFQCVMVNKMVC